MAANRQKNGRKSTKKWPQIEDPKIYLREVENMWAPGSERIYSALEAPLLAGGSIGQLHGTPTNRYGSLLVDKPQSLPIVALRPGELQLTEATHRLQKVESQIQVALDKAYINAKQ